VEVGQAGGNGNPLLTIFIVNGTVITLTVLIHYEFLYRCTMLLPRLQVRHRVRILFGVLAALIAHAAEIWVFAVAFFYMHTADEWGHLQGNFDGGFFDCVYFSFTTYTTLGTGDIEPIGDLRYLTGLESLTGLVLITWTASFLYLEMTRYWGRD
jgi:hypothetical protein